MYEYYCLTTYHEMKVSLLFKVRSYFKSLELQKFRIQDHMCMRHTHEQSASFFQASTHGASKELTMQKYVRQVRHALLGCSEQQSVADEMTNWEVKCVSLIHL